MVEYVCVHVHVSARVYVHTEYNTKFGCCTHKPLFKDKLGTVKPFQATLHVKEYATPKFLKPRLLPFAIKDAIGRELDRLKSQGTIERVDHSDWAAPSWPSRRRMEHFKSMVTTKSPSIKCLPLTSTPYPNQKTFFPTLAGGKNFTKLDLSQAYLQLQLDEKSSTYVTINTHQDLYKYNRLPFG